MTDLALALVIGATAGAIGCALATAVDKLVTRHTRRCVACWTTQAACNAAKMHGDGHCCAACSLTESETHNPTAGNSQRVAQPPTSASVSRLSPWGSGSHFSAGSGG